jgi:hypothetical protein
VVVFDAHTGDARCAKHSPKAFRPKAVKVIRSKAKRWSVDIVGHIMFDGKRADGEFVGVNAIVRALNRHGVTLGGGK